MMFELLNDKLLTDVLPAVQVNLTKYRLFIFQPKSNERKIQFIGLQQSNPILGPTRIVALIIFMTNKCILNTFNS